MFPKQPTLTVNHLIESEYQAQRFQGETPIVSPTFPQLELAIAQIIANLAVGAWRLAGESRDRASVFRPNAAPLQNLGFILLFSNTI